MPTPLTTAREILAGRWFVSSDGPAYRAEVTEAAQCTIDGDDYDLRYHIARADAAERYAGQFDGDFERWLEGRELVGNSFFARVAA